MYISHKANVIQTFHETEWQCRRKVKELDKPEYWVWLDSVTTVAGDPPVSTVDLSGETGYTIVECTDEDVYARLLQLDDYVSEKLGESKLKITYNIKYYASKRDAEEIKDVDGSSHDPKQYVQSHFVGQDDTKDARILAGKWANVRAERDRKIAATDWRVIVASESDEGSDLPAKWKTYRTALRDITDQSNPDNITWPTEPS
jgi:hypothetical protein